MFGETDDDILRPGDDGGVASGGAGDDTIELSNPFGDVTVTGGDGTDSLEFMDGAPRTLSLDGSATTRSARTSSPTSRT